ncbi:signal peptidase I [Terrabacter sp. 2YAF2]|uniref:signal peptidase I n=1 Tax=Terrabacter sp. 2YAF2 TaxID=3233026 RepID=UPI003F98F05C
MKRLFAFLLLAVVAATVIGIGMLFGGHLGYQAFVIRTGSMSPTIPPQSLVVVRTGEYSVGQVVSFVKDGSVVSHRIVRQNPDGGFTTQGDANRTADPTPVQPSQVIGGVVSHVDRLGFWVVYLSRPLTLASLAMLGVFLWAVLPLLFGRDEDEARDPGPGLAAASLV